MACAAAPGLAQQPTPPVMPKILELPLPPPVVLPPPPVAQPDVPNRPLTADEAVQLALHHQPSISVARAGVAGAQGRVQQEQSLLKPSVSVSGEVAAGTSNTGSSSSSSGLGSNVYSASAIGRQLIYDFNHTRDLVHESMAVERSAQAILTKAQADLALQVKQAFYTYLQNVRLVKTSETNVRNLRPGPGAAQDGSGPAGGCCHGPDRLHAGGIRPGDGPRQRHGLAHCPGAGHRRRSTHPHRTGERRRARDRG
jgi:outer membrane protein TolC